MSVRKAYEDSFMKGTVSTVAKLGIENMRTKHVADYTGFSEATLFRMFPTKEILLRDTFLNIDRRISDMMKQCLLLPRAGSESFESDFHALWRKFYRHLVEHAEETLYLIRYRYSSLYTDEVRSMRQIYNGGMDGAFAMFASRCGKAATASGGFLVRSIFEVTLDFAEKVVTGRLKDNEETEQRIWLVVSSIADAWPCQK